MGRQGPMIGNTEAWEGSAIGPYEAPRLTPIGNLRDLLAGDGGTSCDSATTQPSGGHDPVNLC
jgi:hypothetical protein